MLMRYNLFDHIAQLERRGYDSADISIKTEQPDDTWTVLRKLKAHDTGQIIYLCTEKGE